MSRNSALNFKTRLFIIFLKSLNSMKSMPRRPCQNVCVQLTFCLLDLRTTLLNHIQLIQIKRISSPLWTLSLLLSQVKLPFKRSRRKPGKMEWPNTWQNMISISWSAIPIVVSFLSLHVQVSFPNLHDRMIELTYHVRPDYPSATVPLGNTQSDGRPYGLFLLAQTGREDLMFRFMSAWEATMPKIDRSRLLNDDRCDIP